MNAFPAIVRGRHVAPVIHIRADDRDRRAPRRRLRSAASHLTLAALSDRPTRRS